MTLHLDQRMNQRGITREMLDLALAYGQWDGDRCILNKQSIQRLIEQNDRLRSVAVRALDKGGIVVVEAGGEEITTYKLPTRRRGGR